MNSLNGQQQDIIVTHRQQTTDNSNISLLFTGGASTRADSLSWGKSQGGLLYSGETQNVERNIVQVLHTWVTVERNGKGGCVCVKDGCREPQLSSDNTIFSCLCSGEDIIVCIKFGSLQIQDCTEDMISMVSTDSHSVNFDATEERK